MWLSKPSNRQESRQEVEETKKSQPKRLNKNEKS